MEFLTQKSADDEDAVKSLWHDGLKLLIVTDGEKGCRYYTKVCLFPSWIILYRSIHNIVSQMYDECYFV